MNIAYITSSKIPTVYDAQAQRCVSIIQLFDEISVDIISNCRNISYSASKIGGNTVNFYSYRSQKDGNRIEKVIVHFQMKKELTAILRKKKYDYIIFNDLSIGMMNVIKKYRNGARLLYDAVEWYSPSENFLGKLSPNYINNDYVNRRFVAKNIGVISISRFFDEYFSHKGVQSFYMPVVLDKDNYSVGEHRGEHINIIYAGYMGKKDHIKEFVKQFSVCDTAIKSKIRITLVGPAKAQFSEILNFDSIEFLPFMPHDRLLELYKEMDFSFLIRDEKQRYAKAGFPTKLAESMMCGVPVICNLFSNIGDYLKDGQNAIIVSDKENFSPIFERIVELSGSDLLEYKLNARQTAENAFHYKNYMKNFHSFLAYLEEQT